MLRGGGVDKFFGENSNCEDPVAKCMRIMVFLGAFLFDRIQIWMEMNDWMGATRAYSQGQNIDESGRLIPTLVLTLESPLS